MWPGVDHVSASLAQPHPPHDILRPPTQCLLRGAPALHPAVSAWGAGMTPSAAPALSTQHRWPGASLSHAVWLYSRFPLRHRAGAARLFGRGGIVAYAATRQGRHPYGPQAAPAARRRPRPGDAGHLEAGCSTLTKARHALGRAVDQDGVALDILGPRRRHTPAATQGVRTLLQAWPSSPRGSLTEKRPSSRAA